MLSVFLPASAKGGEEFDHGQFAGQTGVEQVLPGREQGAFGVVHGKGAFKARRKALIDKHPAFFGAGRPAGLGLNLSFVALVFGQGVGDFTESVLDGLFVARDADLLLGLGRFKCGLVPACVENGQADAGHERPDSLGRIEQIGQLQAGQTSRRGQADAREKRRPCRADLGASGPELVLGFEDVGAAGQ